MQERVDDSNLLDDSALMALERAILDGIKRIERLENTYREALAQMKTHLEETKADIEKSVFADAETLLKAAAARQRGKSLDLTASAKAKWYRSSETVSVTRDILSILKQLRKAGLVRKLLRKQVVYAVDKLAVRKHKAQVAALGIQGITVEEPKNLFSLSFEAHEASVVKDLKAETWVVSWPPKKHPE